MADAELINLLRQGARAWNAWRHEHKDAIIDLSEANLDGADLSSYNLKKVILSHASLKGANFSNVDLRDAVMVFADLESAVLLFADLRGADLRGANLQHASLEDAKLLSANLCHANLENAMMAHADCRDIELIDANLTGTNLTGANLGHARVLSVRYDRDILLKTLREARFCPGKIWEKRNDLLLDTTCRCKGVQSDSCYGSQRFRIFLDDLDYLEELMETRWGKRMMFIWWIFSDCGRSMTRWAGWSCLFALAYAVIFWRMGSEHFHTSYLPFNLQTMIYYSTVTFTTLGFGDVAPLTSLAAMMITSEVIIGYIMLGGLISIFATILARRSR